MEVKVSIIIPVYGVELFLERAVEPRRLPGNL